MKTDGAANLVAAGISAVAVLVALLSYFIVPQQFQTSTAYVAYILMLAAIITVTIPTGATQSPFVATWVVAAIFAGIFGVTTLGIIFILLNGFTAFLIFTGDFSSEKILSTLLAGELPLLVGYILWHGKSMTDKTKERAYSDLANALDQVANKSDVVIGAINDGVIAVNKKGLIELINPAAQRIIGWGNQDALNLDYKSVLQLLKKDGAAVDKVQDPVFEVLSTNHPIRKNDLYIQTTSGKKIMAEIVVSPIGRMGSGAIIVFRDITVERQKESAQAEFISTASHEMRTPVASIEGYLGLALNPAIATVDEKARDYITKAHEGTRHLGRLFQDLLDVTKADDGRLTNKPKVINVVEFVSDIADGLKQKAIDKKLQLVFKPLVPEPGGTHTVEPIFFVYVDSDHLREAISNLIDNAIKYTPSGAVVVDINGDDSRVVISIQDSGIGIPAEDIPHLFQKFYRVDNRDTREIGGTGLGLYLCRRLVETMNGRIWVKSEYKKGSTFYVELERIAHEDAIRLIESTSDQIATSAIVSDAKSQLSPTRVSKATTTAVPPQQSIVGHQHQSSQTEMPHTDKTAASQLFVADPLISSDTNTSFHGAPKTIQAVSTKQIQDNSAQTSKASSQAPIAPTPPQVTSVPENQRPLVVPGREQKT